MHLALFQHVSVFESIWNVDIAFVNQSEKVELKTMCRAKSLSPHLPNAREQLKKRKRLAERI